MASLISKEDLRAWMSVVRTYNLCNDTLISALKPLGLKMAQFEVLVKLLYDPEQTQQKLAANSYVVKSHMSGLLTEMMENGWVKRIEDENDKRSKLISLTPKGIALANKAAVVQTSVVGAMFAPLTKKQVQETEQTMNAVTGALLKFNGSQDVPKHTLMKLHR
jgi:DNA-binding MarR family transcriptional regulator